jgi:hypothetical protein
MGMTLFPPDQSADLGHIRGCRIGRVRFERLLMLRIDKVRVGTAQNAKRIIGGAWRAIIDDMYKSNAEQLSANDFAPVLTECADAIVRLTKTIKG